MVSVVLGMLFCVALALAVMALVAVPARRAGRDVLTERGEEVVGSIRDRQFSLGRSEDPSRTPSVDDAVGARG
jgi:competence protein ComGC